MSQPRIPFSPGVVILGGGAVLLSAVLLLGFLLPTDWQADASAHLEAAPSDVFRYLDSPEGWRAWTPWPDSGLVRQGPERGQGAEILWDDRELGSGRFTITEAVTGQRVRYSVDVEDGAMRTEGTITVEPEDGGSRVTWHEEGDLGRNPLMGFWGFFMDRAQTTELEKGLARLSEVVRNDPADAEAPIDSASTGAP